MTSDPDLSRAECVHYRDRLRAARAHVLANAEGFESICFAVELLGRRFEERGTGLGDYGEKLFDFVAKHLGEQVAERFSGQFLLMKESRNDYMHVGSHARNAGREAVRVALVLEHALMSRIESWASLEARDVMVGPPVVANPWNTWHEVRSLMLTNAFTVIPVLHENEWYLVSDRWLAAQLAHQSNSRRKAFLREQVKSAAIGDLPTVEPVSLAATMVDVQRKITDGLVLVHDGHGPTHVVGVIAPADVL